MMGKMPMGKMDHDPGSACPDCGMPGDLCTCDAMDQCEEDYCNMDLPTPDKGKK
jgi:hypothetical protein